jgi:hypothetical protein
MVPMNPDHDILRNSLRERVFLNKNLPACHNDLPHCKHHLLGFLSK